jgi:ComF family protein
MQSAKFNSMKKEQSMISNLVTHFLDILFPPRCGACRVRLEAYPGNNFCTHCLARISFLRLPVCRICGLELCSGGDGSHLCGDCLKNPPPFSLARSVVWYDEVVRELVLRLKFRADTSVVPGLTQLIAGYDTTDFHPADWIVPVPLHRLRLRERGLNQALLLARLFFPAHRKRLRSDLLVRTMNSLPQTRLSGAARRKNLRGGFQITRPGELSGAVVCLVDDVFTTGTTAAECSRAMLLSGAKEVRVLTLARVKVDRRG